MTASKQKLKRRWKTEEGLMLADSVRAAFKRRSDFALGKDLADLGPVDQTIIPELRKLLVDLQYCDEVAPALDLRGFEFVSQMRNLDLSSVRFDYCVFNHNIGSCVCNGAVFDGAEGHHSFGKDFRRASFRQAKLSGASFLPSDYLRCELQEADFTGANLVEAGFKEASCRGAVFVDADLRRSYCACVDFSGADLSGANCREATLGSVVFDEATKVAGANLTGASLSADFRQYALSAGAVIGPEEGTYPLRIFDGTLTRLLSKNINGHLDPVISRMQVLRESVIRSKGEFDWFKTIHDEFPRHMLEELDECLSESLDELPPVC